MKNLIVDGYLSLFNFVFKNRIAAKDLSERVMHAHLISIIATGFLMWAYALLAYLAIDHPLPWIVGVTASLIHLLSPLLYRINNNYCLNTNIFLAAGVAHQATFGFFCGGFHSNIIIWFGIIPLLGGIVCGRKGVITWVVACSAIVSGFLFLQYTGYVFPNVISPTGLLFSQALITFGWIYAGALIIWVFLTLTEKHQKEIEEKQEGIQNLICVITHDISNPLTVVAVRVNMLKKADLLPKHLDSITKISSAATNIADIVNNVRNLYATELGKNRIEMADVNLVDIIKLLKENFSDKLEDKKINLSLLYDEDNQYIIRSNADILLHQVLSNLLSNAIKFSNPEDAIVIKLDKIGKGTHICIKDSGIGIPKDLADKLFDIRAKTNRQGTSGETGTGFGLPIVKTYVEKLDGEIKVESIPLEVGANHGTTFTLEF
ncbi:MAG: sensor histidine kinase [Alphaproteobacteria bacterium]|nr:MAG: sensor histidine kinase [Alphaproteobacteria bacterium]